MVNMLRMIVLCFMLVPGALFGQHLTEMQNFPNTTENLPGSVVKSGSEAVLASSDLNLSEEYFSPSFSYIMYAAFAEGDDIYFGGTATFLGETRINSIARFTGGNWLPMGSGFNGSVTHIERINGVIYAGGGFTATGSGTPMNRLAQWNGTSWQQVGPGLDFFVYRFTEYNGNLYIGVANGVYRWDGVTMDRIVTTFGIVDALTVHDGNLYIGGSFQGSAENQEMSFIGRWDGSEWSTVAAFNSQVRALTVHKGELVAGGSFTTVNGNAAPALARLSNGNWVQLQNTPQIGSGTVLSLKSDGDNLYIGGNFRTSRGDHALRYDENDWTGLGFISTTVWDIALNNGNAYLAGNFASSETPRVSYVAAYNGTQQVPLPGLPRNTEGLGAGGDVYMVSARGNDVGMSGFFGNAGQSSAFFFTRRTETGWAPSVPISGMVESNHALGDGRFVIGGDFVAVDGVAMNRIAYFNGTSFEPMGSGFQDGLVYHINEFEGDIIAVGLFTRSGDGATVLNRVARWNGTQWLPMGEGFNNPALKTFVRNGQLYASGSFTMSGSEPVVGVARWTGTRWEQVGNADSPLFTSENFMSIWDLNELNGYLIAGRRALLLPAPPMEPIGALAYLDENNVWRNLGDTPTTGTVYSFSRVGNSLYIAGSFNVQGTDLRNLVRFDMDGFHYAGNPNRVVYSVDFSGTSLWFGGGFDLVGGVASSQIAEKTGFQISPITLTASTDLATEGDIVELLIQVGSAEQPLPDLRGVGFQLNYDAEVFTFVSAEATGLFNNSTDLEFVESTTDGMVAIAVTKTSGATSLGFGNIARIRLEVSNVSQAKDVQLVLTNYEARNQSGNMIMLQDTPLVMTVFEVAVWPGDTNNDGVVDQNDILPIGQFFGVQGPARPESSVAWAPQAASRWFTGDVSSNAVFADATGDGRVNQNDVLPVGINFGQSVAAAKEAVIQQDPLATITIPAGALQAGETYRINLELSDENMPDLLGIAGSVTFGNTDIELVDFLLIGDFLPENPGNLIVFVNEDAENDTYSFAATRRIQDGAVPFTGSIASVVIQATLTNEEAFEVIINEAAVSTPDAIIKNPLLRVSYEQIVSVEQGVGELPVAYGLDQNFPNPFNPTTSITYHVPHSSDIRLSVYDMLGREVAVIVNGVVGAGSHTVNFDARSLSSGMYIYRLQAGSQVVTRKMTVVK